MQGIHARPFTEANLRALHPLGADIEDELLTVLRRKCGEEANPYELARELPDVLLNAISLGAASSKLGPAGRARRKEQFLKLAYQSVLAVRYVRLAATAVLCIVQPFNVLDLEGNRKLMNGMLGPAALGEALCKALLRPKVRKAMEESSVTLATSVAALACTLSNHSPDALGILLYSAVPIMCRAILQWRPHELPHSADVYRHLLIHIIVGVNPEYESPEWPRPQEETPVDLLIWGEELAGIMAAAAADSRHAHHAQAVREQKLVQEPLGDLMLAVCARICSQHTLPPAAARKVLQLFKLLMGRLSDPTMEPVRPASMMMQNSRLHAIACNSLPRNEELRQLEALATVGGKIFKGMPLQRPNHSVTTDCLLTLTGILSVMSIRTSSAPGLPPEPPPVDHGVFLVGTLIVPAVILLGGWLKPETQAGTKGTAATRSKSSGHPTLSLQQVKPITSTISSLCNMMCTWLVGPLLDQPGCSMASVERIAASGALPAITQCIALTFTPDGIDHFPADHKERTHYAAALLVRAAALIGEAPRPSASCMEAAAAAAAAVVDFAATELLVDGAAAWSRSPICAELHRACDALQALTRHKRASSAGGALATARVPQRLTAALRILGRCNAADELADAVHSICDVLVSMARHSQECKLQMAAGGVARFDPVELEAQLLASAGSSIQASLAKVMAALEAVPDGSAESPAQVAEAASEAAVPTLPASSRTGKKLRASLDGLAADLSGTLTPDNVLKNDPQLPSDAIVQQIADALTDCSRDGPWWQLLLDLVNHVKDRYRQEHGSDDRAWDLLTVPALSLLMRAKSTRVSAAAVCAAASHLLSLVREKRITQRLQAELPPRWCGLSCSVGGVLEQAAVVDAAVAAMPRSVGLVTLFAMLAEVNASGAAAYGLRFPELLPGLPHVACAVQLARASPTDISSCNLAMAANSYLSGMGNPHLPLAARRRWLGSPAGVTAATDILETLATVFVGLMRAMAARAGPASLPQTFDLVRSFLMQCMCWMPNLAETTDLAALPASAARNILATVRRLLESPFAEAVAVNEESIKRMLEPAYVRHLWVHLAQLTDIARLLFARGDKERAFTHLVAAAVAAVPAPEQRLHYQALAVAGLSVGEARTANPRVPVVELASYLEFQAAAVCMMVPDEHKAPSSYTREQRSSSRAPFLIQLLQQILTIDTESDSQHERFSNVPLECEILIDIPNPPHFARLQEVWALMLYMARRASSYVALQLLANLGPADDVQGREAAAEAAVEAEYLQALVASLRLEIGIFAADGAIDAKETSVRQALTAIIEVARTIAAQANPQQEVYAHCCIGLARSILATGMLVLGFAATQRPVGATGFKRPPSGAKSIGQLHAELCQVLCELAARESSIQPGIMARTTVVFTDLLVALKEMQSERKPGRTPPPHVIKAAEAAFHTVAEALVAILEHCRGAREQLSIAGWQAETVVPPDSVLAGNQKVAAAVSSIRAAMAGASGGGSTPQQAASAAQAAEAAAAALLAEEDAEKQQEAAKQGKAAKRRKARQRAAQAQQAAGSGGPAAEAGIPDAGDSATMSASEPSFQAAAPAPDGSSAAAAAAEQLQGASLQDSGPAAGGQADLDSWQLCPLTKVRMVDPALAADQHSYERRAIEEWLADHDTSPVTGDPLPHKTLIPNHALRNLLAVI